MSNKKKNSNYVTEKTAMKKEAEAKKRKAVKTKKTVMAVLVPALVVLLIAGVIFTVMFFGGAFDYIPEPTEHVAIELAGHGSLHVELYGKDAPKTVESFLALAKGGYFNDKTVNALIDGNLYLGSEESASDKGIVGEFSANGKENKVPFKVGTLVMARGEDYDSAYGRFFIVTEDTDVRALKGNYAAFGRITDSDGIEVIEKLIEGINPKSDGTIPATEQVFISSVSSHAHHD